jgi:hypothetical protein
VKLATYLHLVLRLRMSGVMHLRLLHAVVARRGTVLAF